MTEGYRLQFAVAVSRINPMCVLRTTQDDAPTKVNFSFASIAGDD